MIFRLRPAWCLAAAILLLGPALTGMASAQEAMQLDAGMLGTGQAARWKSEGY